MKLFGIFSRFSLVLALIAGASGVAVSRADVATTDPTPMLLGQALTAEELAQSGLGKLSAQELAYLQAWLAARAQPLAVPPTTASAATSPASSSDSLPTAAALPREADAADPFEKPKLPPRLVARVLPPFTGWEGRTEFRLDNGQVWRQRLPGRYVHSGGLDGLTEVVITRNLFGFFVLTVSSSGRATGVERVE